MDLQHIVLNNISRAYEYKGSGRGEFHQYQRSVQQRKQHGEKLANKLDGLFPESLPEDYISIEEPGVYLEVTSENGYPLKVPSLDTVGCRLCNVREFEDGSEKAIVFITNDKRQHFTRKLDRYKAQGGGQENNSLFDNIKEIQLASLQDFWTSNRNTYPQGDEQIWWCMSSEPFGQIGL